MSNQAADVEAARRRNGQFGNQSHTDPGVVPVPEPEPRHPGLNVQVFAHCSTCPTHIEVMAASQGEALAVLESRAWKVTDEALTCPNCSGNTQCSCGRWYTSGGESDLCPWCLAARVEAKEITALSATDLNGCAVCGVGPDGHNLIATMADNRHTFSAPTADHITARKLMLDADPAQAARINAPYGCARCGESVESHGNPLTLGEGEHFWIAPSLDLIEARTKAAQRASR